MIQAPIAIGHDRGLLGMLTLPGGPTRGAPVLLCSPLWHEGICSHRPLWILAQRLAAEGRAVLRVDWPGNGDSVDRPCDAAPDKWFDAVCAGVEALRSETGAEEVSFVGLRLGALLGALAVLGDVGVRNLALLAPFANGNGFLRELRAFESMAHRSPPPDAPAIPLPPGALEASGFVVTADEIGAVRRCNLLDEDNLRRSSGRRVLVAAPHLERGTTALARALEGAGAEVTLAHAPRLGAAWDETNSSTFPRACSEIVLDWLGTQGAVTPATTRAACPSRVATISSSGWHEMTEVVNGPQGEMVMVSCRPARSHDTRRAVLLLNAGGVRRSGPNRLSTTFARRWARAGLRSVRIDVHGVGDAAGEIEAEGREDLGVERFYRGDVLAQIDHALTRLQLQGVEEVCAIGLCSGAYWAFHLAARDERVRAVCLLNPALLFWDEGEVSLNATSQTWHIIVSPRRWRSLGRRANLKRAHTVLRGLALRATHRVRVDGETDEVRKALLRLREIGVAVGFVFSSDDAGLHYLSRHLAGEPIAALAALGISAHIVHGPDHTFRPVWSHEILGRLLDEHLEAAGFLSPGTREPASVSTPG